MSKKMNRRQYREVAKAFINGEEPKPVVKTQPVALSPLAKSGLALLRRAGLIDEDFETTEAAVADWIFRRLEDEMAPGLREDMESWLADWAGPAASKPETPQVAQDPDPATLTCTECGSVLYLEQENEGRPDLCPRCLESALGTPRGEQTMDEPQQADAVYQPVDPEPVQRHLCELSDAELIEVANQFSRTVYTVEDITFRSPFVKPESEQQIQVWKEAMRRQIPEILEPQALLDDDAIEEYLDRNAMILPIMANHTEIEFEQPHQAAMDKESFSEYLVRSGVRYDKTVEEVVTMEEIKTAETTEEYITRILGTIKDVNDLVPMTMAELRKLAKALDARGYSGLNKRDLVVLVARTCHLPMQTTVEEVPVTEEIKTVAPIPVKAEMPEPKNASGVVHTHDSPDDFYAGLEAQAKALHIPFFPYGKEGKMHEPFWRHEPTKTILVHPDFVFEFATDEGGHKEQRLHSFDPHKWLGTALNWAVRIVGATTIPAPKDLG